ncbi:sugar transporter [Stipitochalara longipes BDJ]|nr:sugar transporter [Stipitochalara longipes BDJ]
MQPYFGLKAGWLTFWLTVACSTEMALFGYDQGVFSGVVVTENFLTTLGLTNNSKLIGTISALFDVGSFFGAVAAFILGGTLGRKKVMLLGSFIMTIGVILQSAASTVPVMAAGRVVTGLGNGLNTATAPIWQGETAKAGMRGKLIIIELIMCIVGFSLVNWINYALSFVGGPVAWRFPLAFQMIFILIILFTVPWLPESPRWLISKGRVDEAEQILADLEGVDVSDPFIITNSNEIQASVQYEIENGVGFLNLLRGKSGVNRGTATLRRLILGMSTLAMKEMTGINVTSYYLPTLLVTSVGLSNTTARLLTACNSLSYLAAGFLAIPAIERWGRRKMMMFGNAGQCFCYLLITVCIRYTELPGYQHKHQIASASVSFFFLYYIFFSIGWQGIPFLYPAEINSLSMRTKGVAVSTATSWAFNYMVVQITPLGVQNLGWRFYIIWAVCNAAMVPVVYLFYPETADRSLEDIDRFFKENQGIFIFKYKDAVSVKRPVQYAVDEQRKIEENAVEKRMMVDHVEQANVSSV